MNERPDIISNGLIASEKEIWKKVNETKNYVESVCLSPSQKFKFGRRIISALLAAQYKSNAEFF